MLNAKRLKDRYARMKNADMRDKILSGDAIDVSALGIRCVSMVDFILPEFVDGKFYCDAFLENWILSVCRVKQATYVLMDHGTYRILPQGALIASCHRLCMEHPEVEVVMSCNLKPIE